MNISYILEALPPNHTNGASQDAVLKMLVDSVSNLTSMPAGIIPRIGAIERAVNG
jgi:hypothetical protein